jgi:DNA topoisomerase-1
MKLVIVESPAKAKTIAKYLGDGYTVDASRGHILDLPDKEMGVDIDNNYAPVYKTKTKDQRDTIARLKEKAKAADEVFLATDPDREGEAISWHLQMQLKLDPKVKNRIMFNEISKSAVNAAIKNPDYVNMNLVNAQQARRVLDRLVGYTVSPVLSRKVQGKLSAGRVQSAALRIVVDREREIAAFKPDEYWTLTAELDKKAKVFKANLAEFKKKKLKVTNKEQMDKVLSELNGKDYVVGSVKKSVTSSRPQPPFTTSTMQQDAVNKLRMSSSQAMMTAQQLYEGIDIPPHGHVALVTYIRTDSVRVSAEALAAAREYIAAHYGAKYVPETPNFYASKKSAQDAHEAIRPINLELTPESLKDRLAPAQYKLYKLIYQRFLASQAEKAQYNSVNVTVNAGDYGFTATGKTPLFDGYTAIYADEKKEGDENAVTLPELNENDLLKLVKLNSEQKFTKPPARYTEASLIKAMEERGIGRPSTYAAVMATLYKRDYVLKDSKMLAPTELGDTVTRYLEEHFAGIVDIEFTAAMENRLDAIEDNAEVWYKVVDAIYKPIAQQVKEAKADEPMHVPDIPTDQVCEKCGSPMVIRVGRWGKYLACTGADCKNNKSLKETTPPKVTDVKCEKCGSPMLERTGKYGKYLACSNYPNCKNTRTLAEPVAKCPFCGKDVVNRMSKYKKAFYGCTGYPECKFASWDPPTGKRCPKCDGGLVYSETKTGKSVKSSEKNCDYKAQADES